MSDLVENPEDRFSQNEAHLMSDLIESPQRRANGVKIFFLFVCLQAQFGDDYYDVDDDTDVKPVFHDSGDEFDEGWYFSSVFFFLISCLTSMVNALGHVGTVSYPWQA